MKKLAIKLGFKIALLAMIPWPLVGWTAGLVIGLSAKTTVLYLQLPLALIQLFAVYITYKYESEVLG